MDIRSGRGYPSAALSNFAPHPFVFRGVQCNSMEGFLQSLKFKNPDMQKYVCTLVGFKAKCKGKGKDWYTTQKLWWDGISIDRHGKEYQDLLDEAYNCLSKNSGFRSALLASGDAVLTHSIGQSNSSRTILTNSEFCGRLMAIRNKLKKEVI